MRRILSLLVVAFLVALGALGWTFTAQDLDVPQAAPIEMPAPMTSANVDIKAVLAGKMYSSAGLAYRGGNLLEQRIFNMGAILVEHPKGKLLFDTGFGSTVAEQFKSTPWLMQKTARFEREPTVAAQLVTAGIPQNELTGVVLTHAHWDHVSGLVDLPDVPVLVPQSELDFINSGNAATALAREIGTKNYQTYAFDGAPYLGFEHSHDFFGDGSVVAVPAPGHTPGSIFVFINTSDGKHYVLVGDTAWQSEGVDLPAEKPWLARNLVDNDAAEVRGLLVRLHQLKQAMPDLIVIPAHDRRIWEQLPRITTPSPP